MNTVNLLRLISWPYFRKHVLRTMLTTAGIVLGVAVFVGMRTANQSVLDAFSRTVDGSPEGRLQVTPVKPASARRAQRVRPHRRWRSVMKRSSNEYQGQPVGARRRHDGQSEPARLRSRNRRRSVIDDRWCSCAARLAHCLERVAGKNGLAIGGTLPLGTVEGENRPRRREVGADSAFGGNLAIADTTPVKMFGRDRTSIIDLAVSQPHHRQAEELGVLGPGRVEPPSGRAAVRGDTRRMYWLASRACSRFHRCLSSTTPSRLR